MVRIFSRRYRRRPYARTRRTFRRSTTRRNTRKVSKCFSLARRRSVNKKYRNPLPNTALYKFVYSDSAFALSTTLAGGYTTYNSFRGNSLFDPDATGVGVQPYGFDQLCGATAPFQRYQVYSSKITIYPHPTAALAATPVTWIIFPWRTSAPPTYSDKDDIMRIPYARALVWRSADNAGRTSLSNYCSYRKLFPERSDGVTVATTAALSGSNPADMWYWYVYMDSSSPPVEIALTFDVKIKYYTRLSKNDDINES